MFIEVNEEELFENYCLGQNSLESLQHRIIKYILIFREWKRLIDRLTEKNTARWIDGWIDR